MLKTIFSFEFGRWINKPLFYIYAVILMGVGALFTAGAGGVFDSNTATVSGLTFINSPLQLAYLMGSLSAFAFFLLPSIVGATVQKDFKSNMYQLLYSFPFKKADYIFGKFLVGLLISFILLVLLGFGAQIGTAFPGVDQNLIAPFSMRAYIEIYLVFVLPNLILFSAVVFAVTLFSRSVIAGFVAIAVLYFGQSMADVYLANQDYTLLGAYLDPFGLNAVNYYAKYWTITEQNENMLPLKEVVIYNRLIWTTIGLAIFAFTYYKFSFHSEALSLKFWKTKSEKKTAKFQPGLIQTISLPKVSYSTGILQSLKSAWALTKIDLKYIIKGGPFVVIVILALLFMIIMVAASGQIFQTETLPVTRGLLSIPGGVFSIFIALLTFIYTGLLVQRPETTRMYQLEDATQERSWGFLVSKLMSVTIMQMILLSVIMIAGIAIQIYKGFYNFEIDLYLFDLYGVKLINYVIWSFMAFLFFTIIPNFYLALFLLLGIAMGQNFLDLIGVEQSIYKYNNGRGTSYSDISKYGTTLPAYYLYKLYWFGLGIFFLAVSYLFWRRGVRPSFKRTFSKAKSRFNLGVIGAMVLGLGMFVFFGSWIYKETNVDREYISSKMGEERRVDGEKQYKRFENKAQPRITDVNLNINLFQDERNIEGQGVYTLLNKSEVAIDTVFINYNDLASEMSFNRAHSEVLHDSTLEVKLFAFTDPLMPGESVALTFEIANKPNSILRNNSPVRTNGTFFSNGYFPTIGYNEQFELTDDKTRKKYDLEPKERMPSPTDTSALQNTYISNDADWINFEAIVSTAPDQIAMTPGKLQQEWEEDGQRYFHYKMQSKMLNFYSVISARYETYEDNWNGIPITIYYHKDHDYNIERMMKGAKASLAYCSEEFSPYQHDQLRILEFPIVGGNFAQSFANTVPFSEGIGFIADVDDEGDGVDFPFSVTAHEVAHQWWAHQVIGAKVQGATVMSESLSEYVSLKVLEKANGPDQMRTFLKDALDSYLLGRTTERKKEQPLAYVENQQHIHYNKGSLVFYALSDYIGEDTLNAALSRYVDSVAFQEAPYTTCLELLTFLYEATPDSLDYFIEDNFEYITVYNNRIIENNYTKLDNGKYEVNITAEVVKYRADEKGKRIYKNMAGDSLAVYTEGEKKPKQSYPLADYIEVGIFALSDDGDEEVLYLKKHKITEIDNEFRIIVDKEPADVGIDPYNKLIDTNSEDNRRAAEKAK